MHLHTLQRVRTRTARPRLISIAVATARVKRRLISPPAAQCASAIPAGAAWVAMHVTLASKAAGAT
jgi:hypothetical protein